MGLSNIHRYDVPPFDQIQRDQIDRGVKYHTPPTLQATAEAGFPGLKQIKKQDYDGSADFHMADISCFEHFRQDPYYLSDVLPDETKLFDWETSSYNFGWEEVYIKDGKIVDLSEGDYAITAKT